MTRPVPHSAPSLPATRSSSRRGRILIVDDNTELVDTLRAVIASGVPGIAIETAESGAAALVMAQKGFDVAIVDVKLPDVSGIDLCSKLREFYPEMPVVVCTGHAGPEEVAALMKLGVHRYFCKPIAMDELLATVEAALP